MRPLSLSLAAVISVATLYGCATNPPVQGMEPAGPPPLHVWIGYPIGSSLVHPIFVNREAYVAMFEIIPGRGATMVYPRTRADVFASDAHYADLRVQPARMFYYTDMVAHASAQPRYYYVVASAAPLHLSRLLSSLGAMRRVLGRMYASHRPYDVIDRLTALLVPMQADEDWATDLFVDWPVPPMPQSVVAFRLVRCANGRVIRVAANYPYFGCPGDALLAVVAAAPKPPGKELPFDSVTRRPRSGDRRGAIEFSDLEKRRRAEASARPPRTGGMARSPSSGAIRDSDDRASSWPGSEPPRSTAAQRESTSQRERTSRDSGRSPTVERSEPRAPSTPERGESREGKEPE